jgi:hypothetical protein
MGLATSASSFSLSCNLLLYLMLSNNLLLLSHKHFSNTCNKLQVLLPELPRNDVSAVFQNALTMKHIDLLYST